jgi:chorismate mutase
VRAIRGATTVERDDPAQIIERTQELVLAMLEVNGMGQDAIVGAFFSATADLRSISPATAARRLGWTEVPLFGLAELDIEGALGRCIRAMFHVEADRPRASVRHVFLHGAVALRPDLAAGPTTTPGSPS